MTTETKMMLLWVATLAIGIIGYAMLAADNNALEAKLNACRAMACEVCYGD
jgi:hypothetical protein